MYQLTITAPIEKGYTHEHIIEILRSNFKTITYFCMADERGAQFHTHIYVVFASRVRFIMIKRHFQEAHIEKCRGSVSDNVNYEIQKDDEESWKAFLRRIHKVVHYNHSGENTEYISIKQCLEKSNDFVCGDDEQLPFEQIKGGTNG